MTDSADPRDDHPGEELVRVNVALSQWAARSAVDSASLIERFEAMGYPVRGKSEDEIADILQHPPTHPAR